jgi:hypothetical protein
MGRIYNISKNMVKRTLHTIDKKRTLHTIDKKRTLHTIFGTNFKQDFL